MNESFVEDYFIERLKSCGLYVEDNLSLRTISEAVLHMVPDEIVKKFHILPLAQEKDVLQLVTDSAQTYKQQALLEERLGIPVNLLLADAENLKQAIFVFYGIKSYRQMIITEERMVEDLTPIQASVNRMLQDAARLTASDIHLLPRPDFIQVGFRIHGHIYDMSDTYNFPVAQTMSVINIIKQRDTSGKVDVTVHNLPTEGSFTIVYQNMPINVRMETLPVGREDEQTEKINLRLLPQTTAESSQRGKGLDDIGYEEKDLEAIKTILYRNATGLFINSGPTGAGKTTSLYAQIHYLLETGGESLNVITIDDPIEIRDYDFCQVQVRSANNDDLSLTPEKILKASLRSDPDIILYNEIRDAPAAMVAMQASSTGHRVFSTVHAADCIGTISRLLDFDISKVTLLSELKLILSQRLVAKLCPHCSRPHRLTAEEKRVLKQEEIERLSSLSLRQRGSKEDQLACGKCTNGIIGRTAIAEFVGFNMSLRDALLERHSFLHTQEVLREQGFRSMWEKGMVLVEQGIIELEELIHVVGREE